METLRQLKIIAAKEIKTHLRSAWTYTFLILLFVFIVPILFLHADPLFSIGQYSKLTGTIMNLLLYFIPLMTLIISSFSITIEKEDGSLAYLLSYPMRTVTWLCGKFVGIDAVLILINLLCFSLLGIVSIFSNAPLAINNYLFFMTFSITLTIVFTSFGILFGSISKNRWQSLIISVAFWILFILAWPILLITILNSLHYQLVTKILQFATIINPAELVRIFFTIKLGGGTIFGPEYLQWVTWVEGGTGLVIFTIIIIFGSLISIIVSTTFIRFLAKDS